MGVVYNEGSPGVWCFGTPLREKLEMVHADMDGHLIRMVCGIFGYLES